MHTCIALEQMENEGQGYRHLTFPKVKREAQLLQR